MESSTKLVTGTSPHHRQLLLSQAVARILASWSPSGTPPPLTQPSLLPRSRELPSETLGNHAGC